MADAFKGNRFALFPAEKIKSAFFLFPRPFDEQGIVLGVAPQQAGDVQVQCRFKQYPQIGQGDVFSERAARLGMLIQYAFQRFLSHGGQVPGVFLSLQYLSELEADIDGFHSQFLQRAGYDELVPAPFLQEAGDQVVSVVVSCSHGWMRSVVFRVCWDFVFDAENSQIWVLTQPFLSFVVVLRGEKMAK